MEGCTSFDSLLISPPNVSIIPLPSSGICKIMTFSRIVDWKEEKMQWRTVHRLIRC